MDPTAEADDALVPVRSRESVRELCHDVRGPAATIIAVAAAASVETELAPAVQLRLTQIVAEARRIAEICRDVLHDEAAAANRSVVAVHELAESIADQASLTSDVSIVVRAAPSFAYGNPTALGRVLWNLVDNATRAATPGGTVTVDVGVERLLVRIAVNDSGQGFGTADAGGAGLGLRIASRVVAEHGGEITIDRNGELGGASVTVSLPSVGTESAGR